MGKSLEENRAYARGYNRGYRSAAKCNWPDYRPPAPPHSIIGPIVDALRELTDAVDGRCATSDPDDPATEEMWLLVDKARDALTLLGQHARSCDLETAYSEAPSIGDPDEMIATLRAAGLDAWDKVPDPEALIREQRGGSRNEVE